MNVPTSLEPPLSLTLTVTGCAPACAAVGVQTSAPCGDTVRPLGPVTSAYVNVSDAFGSTAVIVRVNGTPAGVVASGCGSRIGAPCESTTSIVKLVDDDAPAAS